ncbi:MAG: type I-U CRISPR-associated protein Csx17, partial [Pseudomonadota bacterium]
MNNLHLIGCRTEPLASYLKGLGVFRLLAEQCDPDARARWEGDHLVLTTLLDHKELLEFFQKDYRPTPIVSPWNGASGFSPGDNTVGIDAISASDSPRFEPYRQVIRKVRSWPEFSSSTLTIRSGLDRLAAIIAAKAEGKDRSSLQDLRDDLVRAWDDTQAHGPGLLRETDDLDRIRLAKKTAPEQRGRLARLEQALKKVRTKIQNSERSTGKTGLMERARRELPDEALRWADAAYVLHPGDNPSYNPVLGTGGNEGHLDFSNNYMQHLDTLLLSENPSTGPLLEAALFNTLADGLEKLSIGQFDPGRAGGFNQGAEVATKDFKVNRWDIVLALEGSLLLSSAVSRSSNVGTTSLWASIPFTVRSTPVGFSSAGDGDNARAETWLPLWSRNAGLSELQQLFAEGRSSVGRRHSENSLDFAR